MITTCTTELSELCSRLEKKFQLHRYSRNGKVILQGDTYNITHGIDPDTRESACYHDNIVTAAFSEDNPTRYIVKGKYLSGQKIVLGETGLGRRILRKLEANMAELKLTDERINRSGLIADVMYLNTDEVFDLIKSFIFA